MKTEQIMEAIGYMDEPFLAENLEPKRKGIAIFNRRGLSNLIAAVLAVALLGCVVLASSLPAAPEPDWEPYAEADALIDLLFGTGRYSVNESWIRIRKNYEWIGDKETGRQEITEERIPITSSASREPVSQELAAMVRPYLIPVGKNITDPTGTMTLEVMTYFYEPVTGCGMAYVRLSDPTGEFDGYVLDAPIRDAGVEIVEDVPKGIEAYLSLIQKYWGKAYPDFNLVGLRFVEEQSNEYNWTFVVDFWPAEDTVNAYIGFRTELWIDYPQYRIELDLNRQPTMETVTLYHGMLRETVMLSPVSLQIKGLDNEVEHLVIHYQDGSSYVVVDEENCVYGWAGQSGIMHRDDGWQIGYLLSNIIDINQVSYVQVDGNNYVPQNP